MSALIVPTIFSAVDEMSPKLHGMQAGVHNFARSAEASFNRIERTVRRLTPGLGDVQKQLLSMVGTGAAIAGAFQLARSSFDSLVNYEESVDQFRTIVSELNDTEFSKFQNEMNRVANVSKRSGTEVAQSFEKIAGLNASFAETAEGIGQVSEASITMAKAAKMDLGAASENLVGIMNQFSFAAKEANRTINVLAAGQAVGAASITQTAESFTVFGSIASGANITLEESVGLIQTLGKYSLFGAEAGTKLRGSILRLQKAGIGYASGQFSINDALNQTNAILAKTKNAKEKDAIINKLFGAENVTAGRILLNNVDTIKEFTKGVSNTSEAHKAAAINTGNLKTVLQELGAKWENYITQSPKVNSAITRISDAAQWLGNNIDVVVNSVMSAVKWFAIYKVGMLAIRSAFVGYNIVMGLHTGLTLASTAALKNNLIATRAAAVGEKLLAASIAISTGNMAAFNAALGLTPLGWAILGVAALAAGVWYLSKREAQLIEQYKEKLKVDSVKNINNEVDAVKKLVAEYYNLGYGIKESTAMAIKFKAADNEAKRAGVASRVSKTKAELTKEKSKFYLADLLNIGTTMTGGAFNAIRPEVGRRAELANQLFAQQQAGNALEDIRTGQLQFAAAQVKNGVVNASDLGGMFDKKAEVPVQSYNKTSAWGGQMAQRHDNMQSKLQYEGMNPIEPVKNSVLLTIKNDSASTVSVGGHNGGGLNVQPQTKSTTTLDK